MLQLTQQQEAVVTVAQHSLVAAHVFIYAGKRWAVITTLLAVRLRMSCPHVGRAGALSAGLILDVFHGCSAAAVDAALSSIRHAAAD